MLDRVFVDAVGHLLADARWARERLMPFAGCIFVIDSTPFVFRARITDEGLLVTDSGTQEPAVRIALPLGELPASLVAGGLHNALSGARIEGDAELAEALGFVFRNLEWDVEEDVARVVGDIPAHRIAGLARAARTSARRGAAALGENVGEFLTEEAGVLVTRSKIGAFGADVIALRDALARLEKRIERVQRRSRP